MQWGFKSSLIFATTWLIRWCKFCLSSKCNIKENHTVNLIQKCHLVIIFKRYLLSYLQMIREILVASLTVIVHGMVDAGDACLSRGDCGCIQSPPRFTVERPITFCRKFIIFVIKTLIQFLELKGNSTVISSSNLKNERNRLSKIRWNSDKEGNVCVVMIFVFETHSTNWQSPLFKVPEPAVSNDLSFTCVLKSW